MTAPIDPADDIWNLLPDNYPKRQDRDALVARAQANPKDWQRRVEIWDFFFPLDRRSLIEPLQHKKEKLLAERSRFQGELTQEESRIAREIDRLRNLASRAKSDWEEWSTGIRPQIENVIDKKSALLFGTGMAALIPCGFGTLILLARAAAEENFIAGCTALILAVPALAGAILIAMGLRTRFDLESKVAEAQSHEYGNLSGHLAKLGEEDTQLALSLENKRAYVAARLIELGDEILNLDRRIATRDRQIPQVPSIETVHSWFTKEFKELEEEIFRESGKEGDLVKLASGTSAPTPFCLRGPAELQDRNQINELYSTNADLNKHLTAKRGGKNSNGKFVDLYGVWVIEFLFLGTHDFTSTRVTFDFITKLKDVQFRTHSYNAVAQVESGYHFRKISVLRKGVNEEEIIDDIPSISFSLENGQRIDVSFLYPSYLKMAFPDVDLQGRSYEDWKLAREAVKSLRKKVHEARLQAGSQSEGGSGQLSQKLDDLGDPRPNPPPS